MWNSNGRTPAAVLTSSSNCLVEVDDDHHQGEPTAFFQKEDKSEKSGRDNFQAESKCYVSAAGRSNSYGRKLFSHCVTTKGLILLVVSLFLINLLTTLSLDRQNSVKLFESTHGYSERLQNYLMDIKVNLSLWKRSTDEKIEGVASLIEDKSGKVDLETVEAQVHSLDSTLQDQKTKVDRLTGVQDLHVDSMTREIVKRLHFPLKSNSREIMEKPGGTCGGLLSFKRATVFRYEVNSTTNGGDSSCIWLVSTPSAVSMEVILTELPAAGQLEVHTNFGRNISASLTRLSNEDLLRERSVNSNVAILMYSANSSTTTITPSSPNLALEMAFSFTGSGINAPEYFLDVSTRMANETFQEIDYPQGNEEYRNNERFYCIIRPQQSDKRVRLVVTYINTEDRHDYLLILKYSSSSHEFLQLRKLMGLMVRGALSGTTSFEGDAGQPMLLYFHTDSSTTAGGFKAKFITF